MRGQQKGVVGTEQGALYELPGGWVWTKLEEVAGKIVDGSHNPPPKQDSTPQFTIQKSVALIKPKITPEYLSLIFQSPFQSSYLLNNAKGTAQKGVYLNQLKGIPIQIAPLLEQRAIVAKIELLNEKELEEARNAHDWEPADKLLERIKAEKEKPGNKKSLGNTQ